MTADTRIAKEIAKHLGKHKAEEVSLTTPRASSEDKPVGLKEGETWFSDVFKFEPNTMDYAVNVLPDNDNPEIARLVPQVDEDYVVQKNEAALLVAGIQDNDKTLLNGPTGSGKSSLVKYICAKLNRPFIRINMSGDVESASLFGTLVVRGGATVWEDGAITEAVKYGAVCLIDEWELMPAEIAMGLQNLLEDNGYLYLKEMPGTSAERTIIPHKDFRLVFAGNTVGQGDTTGAFTGVGVQNTATIDRFTNTVYLGYLQPAHEISVITSKTTVSNDLAKNMVKFAGMVRNAYMSGKIGLTMSPRTLINWARKCKRYTPEYALNIAYVQKLLPDDQKSVMELYAKVFG